MNRCLNDEDIAQLVDGSRESAAHLEAHLERCPRCFEAYSELVMLTLGDPVEHPVSHSPEREPRIRSGGIPLRLAAALVAVVLVGGWWFLLRSEGPGEMGEIVYSAGLQEAVDEFSGQFLLLPGSTVETPGTRLPHRGTLLDVGTREDLGRLEARFQSPEAEVEDAVALVSARLAAGFPAEAGSALEESRTRFGDRPAFTGLEAVLQFVSGDSGSARRTLEVLETRGSAGSEDRWILANLQALRGGAAALR